MSKNRFNQIVVFCQLRHFLETKSQFETTTEISSCGLVVEERRARREGIENIVESGAGLKMFCREMTLVFKQGKSGC